MPLPIVPLVATGASLIKGIFDSVNAGKAEKQASAMARSIPQEDPNVRGYLNDLVARRRNADAGRTRIAGLKRQDLANVSAQTGANLVRSSGGSAGTAIDAQLRNANLTARGVAGTYADAEQEGYGLTQQMAPIISDMADRKLSLQTYGRDTQQAKAARLRSDANANLYGALGNLAGMDWSGQAPSDSNADQFMPLGSPMGDTRLGPNQVNPMSVNPTAFQSPALPPMIPNGIGQLLQQ